MKFDKLKGGNFSWIFLCTIFNTASSAAPQIVSEDAAIKLRTVATTALPVRRFNHSATSHPHSARSHFYTRLDLIFLKNFTMSYSDKTKEQSKNVFRWRESAAPVSEHLQVAIQGDWCSFAS
jgi:hypothetical protein